jgi:hypothetical protein
MFEAFKTQGRTQGWIPHKRSFTRSHEPAQNHREGRGGRHREAHAGEACGGIFMRCVGAQPAPPGLESPL